MKESLSSGNIRSQLIRLAIPLMIGNYLQLLYNTADSVIVGKLLGIQAFAAVGVSGSLMNLFIFVLNGFCVGISILFSTAYGGGKIKEFRKTFFTGLSFGSGFAVFLSVLFIAILTPVLHLISTPEELILYCRQYLVIILGGLIFTYLYNLLSSVLRAIGDTKAALYILAISVVSNVFLDLLFILVFGMGVGGTAAATVLAQGFSSLCSYLYLKKRYGELLCTREEVGLHRSILGRIFSYGIVSALHMSSLHIGKLLVQGVVNTCGTSVIAAFTAATRVEAFFTTSGDAASQSMSIFVSQNRGAGNKERIRSAQKTGFFLVVIMGLSLGAAMLVLSPLMLPMFLDGSDPIALREALRYDAWIAFFIILAQFGNYFVGNSRGHGIMYVPLMATTLQLTVRVVLSHFMIGPFGLPGVALATGIGWIFCSGFHAIMFFRMRKKMDF